MMTSEPLSCRRCGGGWGGNVRAFRTSCHATTTVAKEGRVGNAAESQDPSIQQCTLLPKAPLSCLPPHLHSVLHLECSRKFNFTTKVHFYFQCPSLPPTHAVHILSHKPMFPGCSNNDNIMLLLLQVLVIIVSFMGYSLLAYYGCCCN